MTLSGLLTAETTGLKNALDHALTHDNVPPAVTALHAYLAGDTKRLCFIFEEAHGLLPAPDLPYHFAEGLFRLKDGNGDVIASDKALESLESIADQSHHLASRTRFWLAVAAMGQFFDSHPDHTHLSLNISATAAASPFFTKRLCKAIDALHASHPTKGLIIEMLEHHPWHANRAIAENLKALVKKGCALAVDDYGAYGGQHGPPTLKMAKKLSENGPPLVKIDGDMLERCLTEKVLDDEGLPAMRPLRHRLQEINRHCPNALLVLEWVKNAGEVMTLCQVMNKHGFGHMPIHYVQGREFTQAEANKFLGLDH